MKTLPQPSSALIFLVCGALSLCGLSPVEARTIGFFYALEADLAAFKEGASDTVRSISIGTTVVSEFRCGSDRVFAAKMGSGCVSTAINVQAVLTRFPCDLVISLGPVGALKSDLAAEQWYRVHECIPWQTGSHTNSGFQHKERSKIPLPVHDQNMELVPRGWKTLDEISVASGEVFVASQDFGLDLAERTGCDSVDMNLFGLLSAVEAHDIPSLHFRIVSDQADEDASGDFRKFVESYDGQGGKMVALHIQSLPPDPRSPASYPTLRELLDSTAGD
ncbi:MAG: hypothetical protein AAF546_07275 [Verrucomicrobiota bacterium]